jgi:hypothetical protein
MDNTASSQDWPGAFGAYKPSKEAILRSLATIIWLYVFSAIGGVIANIIFHQVLLLQELVVFAISSFLQAAIIVTVLSSVRGKRMELDEALKQAWPHTLYMFLLTLMLAVTAVISFILLIVPAFIIMPRLSLAPYLLVDKKLNPGEAFKASWELTRGNVGKVWGIVGVTLLMVLPVITFIGILLTIYLTVMYAGAVGLLYVYLSKTAKAPAEPKPAS